MAMLHLVKTYCLPPAVMYGCATWHLDGSDCRQLNVTWNNTFQKIFGCCWREDVSYLLFYSQTLPMSYMMISIKFYF